MVRSSSSVDRGCRCLATITLLTSLLVLGGCAAPRSEPAWPSAETRASTASTPPSQPPAIAPPAPVSPASDLAERTSWEAAEAAGTLEAVLRHLSAHPDGPHRDAALTRAVSLIEAMEEPRREEAYAALLDVAPSARPRLPPGVGIRLLGPPGMRVADLLKLREAGVGDDVVVTKLQAEAHDYGNLDLVALAALGSLGLSDAVLSAMVESSARAAAGRARTAADAPAPPATAGAASDAGPPPAVVPSDPPGAPPAASADGVGVRVTDDCAASTDERCRTEASVGMQGGGVGISASGTKVERRPARPTYLGISAAGGGVLGDSPSGMGGGAIQLGWRIGSSYPDATGGGWAGLNVGFDGGLYGGGGLFGLTMGVLALEAIGYSAQDPGDLTQSGVGLRIGGKAGAVLTGGDGTTFAGGPILGLMFPSYNPGTASVTAWDVLAMVLPSPGGVFVLAGVGYSGSVGQ